MISCLFVLCRFNGQISNICIYIFTIQNIHTHTDTVSQLNQFNKPDDGVGDRFVLWERNANAISLS